LEKPLFAEPPGEKIVERRLVTALHELESQQERPVRAPPFQELQEAALRLLQRVVVADVDQVGSRDLLEQLAERRFPEKPARPPQIARLVRAKIRIRAQHRSGDELLLPLPQPALQPADLEARPDHEPIVARSREAQRKRPAGPSPTGLRKPPETPGLSPLRV